MHIYILFSISFWSWHGYVGRDVINNFKLSDKLYLVQDVNGLYLAVPSCGNNRWRVRYWFDGQENRLSVSTYPVVSLKQERGRCAEIRSMIANK